MKLVIAILVFVLLVIGSVQANDWVTNPANGHRYGIVEGFPWEMAEANAIVLGGHLVTIRNYEENQWILTNVVQPFTSGPVWIGLYQPSGTIEPNEGWIWSSGEPVNYTHWSSGEPNEYGGNTEDWAEMYSMDSPRGYWNDVNLTMTRARYGVVEVIPEPSSLLVLGTGLLGLVGFLKRKTH